MGPSGCGKSTLLHLLGGLDRPSAGAVWLNGRRIDDIGERALARMRRTDVGFVFQAFHLMEELTAVENIELPALLAGRTAAGREAACGGAAGAGRARRPGAFPAVRVVWWSAAAGRGRPRVEQRAAGRACRRADREPGQCRDARRPAALRGAAPSRPDPGHRHPRRAGRGHRGPDVCHARRRARGRDSAERRHHRKLGGLVGLEG